MEFKYVVVTCEETGEQMFMFPKSVDHDVFADILSYIKIGGRNWKRSYREPVSAGFTNGKTCYGRSETLHLNSRGDVDTALLNIGGETLKALS